MNTELQTFEFQSRQLTVITDEHGESWFIAKEVAEILEYSDAEAMTRKLDEDEVQNLQIVGFGNRGVNVINESGLWSSVLRSTKPEAKAVKKWLTSEVLPSIRKTGGYRDQDYNVLRDKFMALIESHVSLLNQTIARLQTDKPTRPQTVTPDIVAAVLRCRAEGFTYGDIGELLHRSANAISHIVRKVKKGG